jgi:hypothetical protein
MRLAGSVVTVLLFVVLRSEIATPADGKTGVPLLQSPGFGQPYDLNEWRRGEQRGALKPYPPATPGTPNPAGGLFQFGGSDVTSFGQPTLSLPFAAWMAKMKEQRPAIDAAARKVLEARFSDDVAR